MHGSLANATGTPYVLENSDFDYACRYHEENSLPLVGMVLYSSLVLPFYRLLSAPPHRPPTSLRGIKWGYDNRLILRYYSLPNVFLLRLQVAYGEER